MEKDFATATGFTQREIESYFGERIKEIAAQHEESNNGILKEIKDNYNGYTWDGERYIYNPFSFLSFLESGQFNNYWFETGTPTFLIKHLRKNRLPDEIEGTIVQKGTFNKFDIANMDVIAVMFQTGYLTIKKIEGSGMLAWLTLGYPNNEVRFSFESYLLEAFAEQPMTHVSHQLYHLRSSLLQLDPPSFVKNLKAFFASVPYHTAPPSAQNAPELWEGYFHALTFLLLKVMGMDVQAEVATATGRTDAVVKVPDGIWVIEFKLGSARSAMYQIKKQGYAEPYLTSGQPVILLGLGFDRELRNVKSTSWKQLGGK